MKPVSPFHGIENVGLERSWFERAREVPVLMLVNALGLTIGFDAKSFGPCPNCGLLNRNNPDRAFDPRGRCIVTRDGRGWKCVSNGSNGCGASGGGPGLVAWVLTKQKWQAGDASTSATVRRWYAELALRGVHPAATPDATVASAPPRMSRDDLERFWAGCVPVDQDVEASTWLAQHHDGAIDPKRLAELDLARVLPANARDVPSWAKYLGQPWAVTGHRLIVKTYAAENGQLEWVGFHARNVGRGVDPKHKAAWPSLGAGSATGLVLHTGRPIDASAVPLVELCEGVPDFLRHVLLHSTRPEDEQPYVLGVLSGSADADVAALVPAGWTVAIRTHADGAGDDYAARWFQLLAPRDCKVLRHHKKNQPSRAHLPQSDEGRHD